MAVMDKYPESHNTDAELNARYPHLIAIPDMANMFRRVNYRFLPRSAKEKYWRFHIFPLDYLHFHRWN